MYFLGVAGYGAQAVFRREVLFAKDYFDKSLNTSGRSIVLINDKQKVDKHPLATKTSISRTLHGLSEKMDPEQDILFVYLSSHGSKSHEFSLNQPGLKIGDLSAQSFAKMIEDVPVKWKVIIVSACYSGGFIPLSENNSTLIMTASAADKKSFGCSDENHFTYFGEAFFKDSLPTAGSFVDAFSKATAIIAKKESGNGYELSEPQISKPDTIVSHLSAWWATRASVVAP